MIISFGDTSEILCTAPTCTLFRSCKFEAVAEDKIGDMWLSDNFLVCLQWAHDVEGSHIEHMFRWRPHAHKLFMKFKFHSYILCFCTLEIINILYTETVLGVFLNTCSFTLSN
jgi:hypothetical protein